MILDNWYLFFLAVFLLSGTPGPNMLHILTRSVAFGLRLSLAAMAGCLTGLLVILAVSGTGIAAALIAFPVLYEMLRYAAAAYLVLLGIMAWRTGHASVDCGERLSESTSTTKLFRGGFIIGVSNPKLLLFVMAFFPQFIDPTAPAAPQFAILVLTFAFVEMFWYVIYGSVGRALARYLASPALKRAFSRVSGLIFVGFGMTLLKAKPA